MCLVRVTRYSLVLVCVASVGCQPTQDKDGGLSGGDSDETDEFVDTDDTDPCLANSVDCDLRSLEEIVLEVKVAASVEDDCEGVIEALPGWSCDEFADTCKFTYTGASLSAFPTAAFDPDKMCMFGLDEVQPGGPVEPEDWCEDRAETHAKDQIARLHAGALRSAAEAAVASDCRASFPTAGGAFWRFKVEVSDPPGTPAFVANDTDCGDCPEGQAEQLDADYVFRVDPLLSQLRIVEPGGGLVVTPLDGFLFGAADPARFLKGGVKGGDVTYLGQTISSTAAGFDVPMLIDVVAGTVTIQPTNQDDIWWWGIEEATDEPIAFGVAPTQPITGVVDMAAGTFALSFAQTEQGMLVEVELSGNVWNP